MPVCMGSQERKFLVRVSTAVIKTTNNQKKLGEEIVLLQLTTLITEGWE